MYNINGSVLTAGQQNFLPLNVDYNFQRTATSLVLHCDQEDSQGNVLVDDSPYNQPCFNYGGLTLSDEWKKFGKKSLKFNGTDSYAYIPNNGKFIFNGMFTIYFWMLNSDYSYHNSRARRILTSYDVNQLGIYLNTTNSESPYCGVYSNSAWRINGNIPVSDGVPHMVAVTRDSQNIIRLFVDGIQSGSTWTTSQVFNSSASFPLILGMWENDLSSGFYNGFLDELVILNGVCLWSGGFTPPTGPYHTPSYIDDVCSGVKLEGKIGVDSTSMTPMYFDVESNSWHPSIANNPDTLPAKALLLEDAQSNDVKPLLKYGTVKRLPQEIEPKYLNSIIPDLTSNNMGNGYVLRRSSRSDSDSNRTYDAWHAFYQNKQKAYNSINSSYPGDIYWCGGNGTWNNLAYISIELPDPKLLKSYVIYPRYNTSYVSYAPVGWRVKGSNDGINWTLLDIRCAISGWTYNVPKSFTINNNIPFKFYQFFDFSTGGFAALFLYDENGVDFLPSMSGVDIFVSAGSTYGTNYEAYRPFMGSDSTVSPWYCWAATATGSSMLNIDLGCVYYEHAYTLPKIDSYSIQTRSYENRSDPISWTFEGSDDNSNWTILHTIVGESSWGLGESRSYNLPIVPTFRYYRLNITQSEVIGTFTGGVCIGRMQLYYQSTPIIPNMTASAINSTELVSGELGTIAALASSEWSSSYSAWNAFDPEHGRDYYPSDTACWLTTNNTLSGWVQVDFGIDTDLYPREIDSYYVESMFSWNHQNFRNPKDYKLQGSNNGSDWDDIHVVVNDTTSFPSQGASKRFQLDQTYSYRFYRFSILDTLTSTTPTIYTGLSSLQFYYQQNNVTPHFKSNNRNTNGYFLGNFKIRWNQSYPGWEGYKILNKVTTSDQGWWINNTSQPEYHDTGEFQILEAQLPTPRRVDSYGFYGFDMWGPSSRWTRWYLYGSNDNINWDMLDYVSELPHLTARSSWPFLRKITNPGFYLYYRFFGRNNHVIGIDLYETPRNYSTKNLYVSQLSSNVDGVKESQLETLYLQNVGTTNGHFRDTTSEYEINYVDFSSLVIKDQTNNLGDVTLSANTNYTSDLDGAGVTLIYQSLIINSGISVTTSNRCQYLKIIVKGDCTINGTLTMTNRGCAYSPPWNDNFPITDEFGNILEYIPRFGGIGGYKQYIGTATPTLPAGNPGQAGINGGCGGGGAGGGYYASIPGSGGNASCFSGGAGGGGACNSSVAGDALHDGGCGGRSNRTGSDTYYVSGGAGNPGGAGYYRNGTYWGRYDGTGGVLILIVRGNLIIGSTGVISCDGRQAHAGSTTCLGGGGGSGGGSLNIFYGESYTNSGSVHANGGAANSTGYSGGCFSGAGGAGSVRIIQI